ncbi:hypothetical protein SU69_06420 [Thermosipho melanesiensis]|uniref:DUF5666 domain-containing protein n=2 Tax=Thermosipho melanesiensis TaxID=46541 RepID=A6LMG5_THEM4|nr:hypothetical protein [Thermosipho melanesiensis]ABR31116.1 hypothetical protein Tmel_1267 [Thermosipho melanesiensis BI429]APT74207.1 hypothetical protein BW47_06740 [Thermosipho melanesiensis]OOC36154.1 hypothetical protein SU68_06490 [Thermosipho melanesiensis]OOC36970.1 hypothetical protein SU69_06420 [Thermosipho melanesiensis]OOC37722.1 hypothetical protein SU70_06430 [Thermosipho melanesiensis]
MKKFLFLLLILTTVSFSETIVLKDGSQIKGEIQTVNSNIISIKSIVGQIVSYTDLVKEIYFDETATPIVGIWIEPNENEWINIPGKLTKFDGNSGTVLLPDNGTFVFSSRNAIKYSNFAETEKPLANKQTTSIIPGKTDKLKITLKNNGTFSANFSSRLGDVITFTVERGIISIPTNLIKLVVYPENTKYSTVFILKDGAKIYSKILKFESNSFLIETAIGVMFIRTDNIHTIEFLY